METDLYKYLYKKYILSEEPLIGYTVNSSDWNSFK